MRIGGKISLSVITSIYANDDSFTLSHIFTKFFELLHDYMALRAEKDSSIYHLMALVTSGVTSAVCGRLPEYEWKQWVQLFEVAVLSMYSISTTDLLRKFDQQHLREAAFMGSLTQTPGKRKVVSLLYI